MRRILMAMVAVAVVAMAGVAAEADTTTVSVNATVTGTCRFLTGGSVAFTLDPASVADAAGTVTNPTFWCTNGTAYTITDDDGVNDVVLGVHRMRLGATTNYIPYAFSYTSTGTGGGRTAVRTMNIAATVVNSDFANAAEGSYADTVTLTINP